MLSAYGAEDGATDAYLLGADRVAEAWPDWAPGGLAPEAILGGKDVDRRLVDAPGASAAMDDHAQAGHPGATRLITRFSPILFHRLTMRGIGMLPPSSPSSR